MSKGVFIVLLALYSSLPALFTGVVAGRSIEGLILFGVQLIAAGLLFKIRKRRQTFAAAVVFFLLLLLSGLSLGYLVHPFFYILLLLYPGPILALSYSLVYRFSRRQDFSRLAHGINLILLLLLSYSIMLLVLKLHWILVSPEFFIGMDLAVNIYESLNYLPALYILFLLRNSADNTLKVVGGTFLFRNESIDVSLNPREHYILSFLLKSPSRSIRCRDLLLYYQQNGGDEKFTCEEIENCRASRCPGYSIAYRNISSLGKKLESLGVGSILPPENKRDIVKKGWKLSLFSGVRVKFSKSPRTRQVYLGEKPSEAAFVLLSEGFGGKSFLREVLHEKSPFLLAMLLAVLGTSLFTVQVASDSGTLFTPGVPRFFDFTSGIILPAIFVVEVGLLILSTLLFRRKAFDGRSAFIVPGVLIFFSLALSPVMGEPAAFFLALRNMVLLAVLFLLIHTGMEPKLQPEGYRERVSGILFWLIWSYMVTFTVFDEPVFISGTFLIGVELYDAIFMVTDRLLLTILFILSVAFYSLPGRILEVRGGDLFFQKMAIDGKLSLINTQLLREFLISPEGILYCREILKKLEPEKAGVCDTGCKPSVCRYYQKIYKRIREIREFMETAGIGTIVSPDRFSAVHEEGWKLSLYEDVRIFIAPLRA